MARTLATLALIAVLVAPNATAAPPDELALVREAVGIVRLRHWNAHLDVPTIVRAGVGGLRRVLRRADLDAVLPEIPAGLDEARTLAALGERLSSAASIAAGRVPERELTYGALRAMLAAVGDSHTYFLDPRERALDELAARGLGYVGIGVGITDLEGRKIVTRVIRGSPADLAGVRRGDVLVRVGETPVDGLDASEVRALIVGDAGTAVVLVLRRGSREFAVSVVRGPVTVPVVESWMLAGRVAYLKIYGYPLDAAAEIRDELARVLASSPRALIVDLRENSGGFLREYVDTMGLFLPAGTVVGVEYRRDDGPRRMITSGAPLLPAMPTAVLVDLGTASAGELTAAALRERAGAVLVGGRTAGALETGILVGLSDRSGVNVAIARMLTGAGVEVEGRGFPPDVLVPNDPASDQDVQLERALRLLLERLSERRAAAA